MERTDSNAPIHTMPDGTEIFPPLKRRSKKENKRPQSNRRRPENFTGNVKLISSDTHDSAAKERLTQWSGRYASKETKDDYKAYINSRPRNESETGPSPDDDLSNPEDQWSLNDLVKRAKEVESFDIELDESQMNEIEVRAQEQLKEADLHEVVEFAEKAHNQGSLTLLGMAENAIIEQVSDLSNQNNWTKEQELKFLSQIGEAIYEDEEEEAATEEAGESKSAEDSSAESRDSPESTGYGSAKSVTEEEDTLSAEELEELAKSGEETSDTEDDDALSPEELEELAKAGTDSEPAPTTPDPTTTPTTPDTAPATPDTAPTPGTEPTAEELAMVEAKLIEMLENARSNNPEYAAAIKSLQEKRDVLAAITARKIGKPISLNRSYNQARDEYIIELRKLGRLDQKLVEDIKPGRSDEEKKIDAVAFIFEQQKELRAKVNEIFGGTTVSRFNKAVGKFFAEGSKKKRIAKGLAVGFGIGLVGGALGAVVGTAGVASIVATRFIKNYAVADKERKGMADLTEEDRADLLREMPTEWGRTLNLAERADALFDRDKKAEQKKRRKAVGVSLSATALGAVGGAMIHEAADLNIIDGVRNFSWEEFWRSDYERQGNVPVWESSVGEQMQARAEAVQDRQEHLAALSAQQEAEAHERLNTQGVGLEIDDSRNDSTAVAGEHIDSNGATTSGDIVPDANSSANTTEANANVSNEQGDSSARSAAETIRHGEGWGDTMREMGVPAKDRLELLNLAGPALVEQGIGYVDYGLDGSKYGIRMTPDGKMPEEALAILVNTAKENGITMLYRP